MLERRTSNTGVVYYASPLFDAIGVRHAFSTRCGGISPAPFDSLNLGNPNGCSVQDDYSRIWENYSLLLSAIECPAAPPLRVHQVHGGSVVQAEPGQPFDVGCKADAIVSRDSARPISVRTADCIPILLASADGSVVAAIHAGWRGIVAGVIRNTVQTLLNYISTQSAVTLAAAVGPCIGFEAFEVGPEVITGFRNLMGEHAPVAILPNDKGAIDLRTAARRQLIDCGLASDRVDVTDRCTFAHKEEFFSHRRERGITGRMAAVIAANRL